VGRFLNDLRKCDILILIIDRSPVVEYKFGKIVDLIEFDFKLFQSQRLWKVDNTILIKVPDLNFALSRIKGRKVVTHFRNELLSKLYKSIVFKLQFIRNAQII